MLHMFAFAQSYMPIQGSTFARGVDSLFDFTIWASIVSFIILIGGLVVFVVKYQRRSDSDKTAYITHNVFLEFLWSFIPLCIFLGIFVWGYVLYKDMRAFPENAIEVNVMGYQWGWTMTYANGKQSGNELVVPVGKPVVLTMTSKDVIHSFYVPSFRIKQDAVPGKRSKLWFQSDRLGDYEMFCTEYCGTAHSKMIGKVRVVTQAEFNEFLAKDKSKMTLAELGQELYSVKGCVACHSTDGTVKVGPSFKGLWASTVNHSDGSTAAFDENYVRSSVLNPQEKFVAGFANVIMPTYQGQVTEEELTHLIEFIKSLK